MIRVNLLPVREAQRKERLRSQISILVLSLIAVFLLCGVLYTGMELKIKNQTENNRQVQQEINKLKAKIGKVNEYKRLKADLQKKLQVLAQLKNQKSGPVRLMDDLSAALPEKLWLTKFSQKGTSIQITGTGVSEPIVADFLRRLEQSPYYQNVELQVTKMKSSGELKLQDFTVTARVEDPSAPKAPAQAGN